MGASAASWSASVSSMTLSSCGSRSCGSWDSSSLCLRREEATLDQQREFLDWDIATQSAVKGLPRLRHSGSSAGTVSTCDDSQACPGSASLPAERPEVQRADASRGPAASQISLRGDPTCCLLEDGQGRSVEAAARLAVDDLQSVRADEAAQARNAVASVSSEADEAAGPSRARLNSDLENLRNQLQNAGPELRAALLKRIRKQEASLGKEMDLTDLELPTEEQTESVCASTPEGRQKRSPGALCGSSPALPTV